MCIGKWHLGHHSEFLPTRHGFNHYFGIPYSNDMNRAKANEPPIPLLRDETIIEQPAAQDTLTPRYTEEAVKFIKDHAAGAREERPFFLYLPYTFPHVPLHASPAYRGKSARGLYGDVVEELDGSAGQILQALRDLKLAGSTLVIFTSDNGPWLIQGTQAGSAGLFREGKHTTWEGGVRVPFLAWWPGAIAPGRVVQDLASELDLFATCLELAGGQLATDRPVRQSFARPDLARYGWGVSRRGVLLLRQRAFRRAPGPVEAARQDDRSRGGPDQVQAPSFPAALQRRDRPVRAVQCGRSASRGGRAAAQDHRGPSGQRHARSAAALSLRVRWRDGNHHPGERRLARHPDPIR